MELWNYSTNPGCQAKGFGGFNDTINEGDGLPMICA
jgi:hypothetical protein